MKDLPNILIVDDTEENLIFLEAIIKKINVNLIQALSGIEALEKTQGIELALAIIDVRMPEMNGYELAVKMNEERYDDKVPVIFLTTNFFSEMELFKGYDSGAVDYMFKPIINEILLHKVNIFIDLFNKKQTIIRKAAKLEKSAYELAKTNDALVKSERKYQSYIDTAPDGVFVADETGRYLEVNKAACRITGYTKDELLNMTISDIMPEESVVEGLAHFNKLVHSGSAKSDLSFRHKNGTKRWWTVDAVKLTETRFLGFVRDITKRMVLEESLRTHRIELELQNKELIQARSAAQKAAEKYTELYDFAPSGFFTLSKDGKIIELNLSGAIMLGLERSRLKNSLFRFFVANDARPAFRCFLEKLFNSKETEACELAMTTDANLLKYVHLSGIITENEEQCLITMVDITKRKQAEGLLLDIIENNPISIQIVDKEGFTLQVNPAHTELFKAIPPKNFSIFEDLQKRHPELEKLILLAKNGEVVHLPDLYYNMKDTLPEHPDVPLWIRAVIFPLNDNSAKPERFVIMHENITESKQAEEELRKNEERFRHISSTISDISYSCQSDQDGNFSVDWMTGSVHRITGYTLDEMMVKKCWGKLVIEEDLGLFKKNVTGLSPGSNGTCELRLHHKSGRIVWVASYAECILDQGRSGQSNLYGALVDITLRKQAEEDIRKANLFLESIIENIPDMIFLKDAKELRFVRLNRAGEEMLGVPQGEILGKNDHDFFLKEQADFFIEKDRETLHGKEVKDIPEEPIQTRHQGIRILHTKKVPLLNSLGEPEYLLGISEDITEIKQAEDALRVSEERYRILTEQSPVAIERYDEEGVLIDVNPACLRLFGVSDIKEIQKFNLFADPNLSEEYKKKLKQDEIVHYQTLFDFGKVKDLQLYNTTKSGSIWIDAIIAPLKNKDNIVNGYLVHVSDITKRKQAEEALLESEEKFRLIVENSHDIIYLLNAEGVFVFVSPAWTNLLGHPITQVAGQSFQQFVHPDDIPVCMEFLLRVISTGQHQEGVKYRVKHMNGTWHWHTTSAVPLKDKTGLAIGFYGIARDITERKKAEDLLQQTRQNYETFFNTIDEFLFVIDEQGDIIHTNAAVIDRLGYSREELFEKSVLQVHPPEYRDEAGRIIGEMLNKMAEFCPIPLITKSGVQIPVETRVSQGIWDGKQAIFGVSKNISQIKLSEEKFSKVFYLSPSACGLDDPATGRYIEVNEAFYSLLGFDKDEVIGKTALELGIFTAESLNALLQKIGNNEKVFNLEANLRAKNGDIKDVLLSAENIYIQDKKYRFTVVHDFTSRKQAEQAMKVSEEKYKSMLNASPDGILLVDLKGIITEVSEIGLELLGAETRDDLVGKKIFHFVPFEEKNTLREIIEKTMSEGLAQNIALNIRRKNKSVFVGETSTTLIQGSDGSPLSFMIIVRDISQRKKMETKQIHADRMASLGEMASGIAHEINQPLNIISHVMDNIMYEAAREENIGKEYLKKKSDKIFENITRVRNIIDHIRAFSKSNDDYILTAFDINSSIENAVSMIAEQFKYLAINLNLQLEENLPSIIGNTFKFEQVILNMLSNAKDALLEKKSKQTSGFEMFIAIRSFIEDQRLIVEIADNGTGISEDDIEHIMLPFYTTKDTGKGTGLGLSISYQIIKEMNGTIEIKGNAFLGTTFKIVLKIQKKEQA